MSPGEHGLHEELSLRSIARTANVAGMRNPFRWLRRLWPFLARLSLRHEMDNPEKVFQDVYRDAAFRGINLWGPVTATVGASIGQRRKNQIDREIATPFPTIVSLGVQEFSLIRPAHLPDTLLLVLLQLPPGTRFREEERLKGWLRERTGYTRIQVPQLPAGQ